MQTILRLTDVIQLSEIPLHYWIRKRELYFHGLKSKGENIFYSMLITEYKAIQRELSQFVQCIYILLSGYNVI